MGGDEPLDCIDILKEIIAKVFGLSTFSVFDPAHFTPEVISEYSTICKTNGYKWTISRQVLGVAMMQCGAPIDDALKAKLIRAANGDGWAKSDGKRLMIMEDLITKLITYDGTPVEFDTAGLIETLLLSEGPGLVNKNLPNLPMNIDELLELPVKELLNKLNLPDEDEDMSGWEEDEAEDIDTDDEDIDIDEEDEE